MANYPPSAPFFGMPPYAHGFPPQSAPPPPGAGPAYHNAPQLPPPQQHPPPPPPQQQQAHNASGVQNNTSLPPMDFNALGLNPAQFAALWQQTLPGIAPVPQFPASSANLPAPNNRVMEIVNGDKEEGELSDEPGSQDDQGRSWTRSDGQLNGRGDSYRPRMPAAVPGRPPPRPRKSDRSDELNRTDFEATPGNDRRFYGMPSNGGRPKSPQWPNQHSRRSPIHSPKDRVYRESRLETSQYPAYQSKPESQGPATLPRPGDSPDKHDGFDRDEFENRRQQAETFLTVLHSCGYSYADLQKCGFDPKLVKEVWTSLGFSLDQPPLEQDSVSSAKSSKVEPSAPATREHLPASASAPSPTTATPDPLPPTKPQPTIGMAMTNKVNAGATASSPTDRAAYIARLMAAKNSKAAQKATLAALDSSTPSSAPVSAAPSPVQAQTNGEPSVSRDEVPQQKATPPTDPAVLAAQKKEAQNELLRRKIEALKIPKKKAEDEARAKAQAVAASLSASRTPSSSGASTAAPSKSEIPVRPAQKEIATAVSTPSKDPQVPHMPVQSPGGIPGLFMTAPFSQVAPQPSQPSTAVPPNRGRKRPVAADFEDLQQSQTPTSFKRPFGQSHNDHEQMIIEVSDDETAGSIMDIDEADEPQPSVQQSSQPLPRVGAARNLPPLTNFPTRPNFSRQGSAQSTPPAAQTPISAAKIEDLRRKEEEIAALKKKLAEKERQRLAKSQSSRAQTPATPTHQPSQTPQQVSSPSAHPPVHKEVSRVQQPTNADSASRSGTPAATTLISAPQSPAESEWRRRKRAEIQSGISAYDADMKSNLSRLEQLRREMEQIEAENRRRQQEKETLINELEGLGIDTEGMPHEELQAKRDEIMQQQEAKAAAAAEESTKAAGSMPLVEPLAELPSALDERKPQKISKSGKAPSESSGEQMSMSEGEIEDESDTTEAEMDMSDSDAEKDEPVPIQTAASTMGTTAAPKPIERPQATLVEKPQSKPVYPADGSEQEDTEDFYSPDPPAEVSKVAPETDMTSAKISPTESAQQTLDAGESEAAEDEDDYAPPEPLEGQLLTAETVPSDAGQADLHAFGNTLATQKPAGAELGSAVDIPMELSASSAESSQPGSANLDAAEPDARDASSEAMDEGEDDYDPSDMLPEPSPSAPAGDHSTPHSISSEGMTGLSAPQSVAGGEAAREARPSFIHSASGVPSQTPQMSIVADELAPELQGQNSEGDKSSHSAPEPIDPKRQAFYTAYESPLQRFKAYRYHPQYSHSVSGGYRSLTYSHEIDPMKPVCPFETAGGICNDSACDGQHFRAMSISEDKILVQLGIVNPGRTPEEQEQWRVGLKQVLKGLREDNVRDAESVAAAITKYRREFLQDPSRVLNI
ncbi:hypothetical protein SLS56_003364 [Neofusicoccum ribis]|uniref:Putative zinc-finger domain-containing protein n=1 Tax=Neofusicoccum ribis TaxID=45134 RepID=A0ABR3SZA0_9PEZI